MRVVRIRWARVGALLLGVALALRLTAAPAEREAARAEVAVWQAQAAKHDADPAASQGGIPGRSGGCSGCTAFFADHELGSGATGWVVAPIGIVEPAAVEGAPGYPLEIYDVQDLVGPSGDWPGEPPEGPIPQDAFVALMRALSGPEPTWDAPASLELHLGQLIVIQAPPIHARIRSLLRGLRALAAPSLR